jgi:DNA-binding CsgD family transcriptional regulator
VAKQLLERDAELARIQALIESALTGEGRCLLIKGPAGIGKTRLVQAAGGRAREAGMTVLAARGGELESEFAYGLVRQLFEPLLAAATPARRERLLSGAARPAGMLVAPQITDRPDAPEGGHSLAALHALYWLTANLAAEAPVILAVDDAQWCDAASLRFLLYLIRRLDGLAAMVVIAARSGSVEASDARLLGLLSLEVGDEVLWPAPLSAAAVRVFVAAELQQPADPEFAEACLTASGGNPFLLGQLTAALAADGVRPSSAAAHRVGEVGPPAVAHSIMLRLARLPAAAATVARAVAVLGGDAELRHVAALAGVEQARAAQAAETLATIQILTDRRPLGFVHPLVRAAIYADISPARRAHEHRRAAQILAQQAAPADAVAAHLLHSEPAGDGEVVAQLRDAAASATERGAPEVAARYLRRALAEPPEQSQRAGLLVELGNAELDAGQPAAVGHLRAALAATPDPAARVRILQRLCLALIQSDRAAEAVALVDDALAKLHGRDPALEEVLEAIAVSCHRDLDVASAQQERSRTLCRRAADPGVTNPVTLAVAATASAWANRPAGEVAALAERAVAALRAGYAAALPGFGIDGQLGVALMSAERYELLFALSEPALTDARRRGLAPAFVGIGAITATAHYRCGALTEAQTLAADTVEVARLYGYDVWLPVALAALLNTLVECGELDDAERLLQHSGAPTGEPPAPTVGWIARFLHARGLLRVAQGRTADGLADFLACGARCSSPPVKSPTLWAWRSDAALAHAALGNHAQAHRLAAEELRLAEEFGAPRALGVALRAAGLVTGGAAGLAQLERATQVLAGSPALLEQARALTDLGAARRRAGHRADAREPLRHGLELAQRCGATVLAQRASDELTAAGARRHAVALTGVDALTPSERRVARMAADGLSNPQIAQALFLTRRTVETHLTHAYRKLNITRRDQLHTALADHPTG